LLKLTVSLLLRQDLVTRLHNYILKKIFLSHLCFQWKSAGGCNLWKNTAVSWAD